MNTKQIQDHFKQHFSGAPDLIVRAPGRVNLIGEHTDYNDGFVFPMAIDRAVWIALRPRSDHHVIARMIDFDATFELSLSTLEKEATSPAEYIKGVAWALSEMGYELTGWEGVIQGDVPIGAGLSSSAALEMAVACAFSAVSGFEWEASAMAKVGQKAENEWVGLSSGIMDQMISAGGESGHALLIDCRSLESTPAPLPPDTAVVVLDTSTRRGLVDSKYNERRSQCEQAASFFGVPALRDVSLEQFNARSDELDAVTMRRARHVITENVRTLQAQKAMENGDAIQLGQLMNASHISLRDDYEVSSEALDSIVECAQQHPACYGARMTGAGFGGCAVALVNAQAIEDFISRIADCYHRSTSLKAQSYACHPAGGASVIWRSPSF